jgi:hypothetical protein
MVTGRLPATAMNRRPAPDAAGLVREVATTLLHMCERGLIARTSPHKRPRCCRGSSIWQLRRGRVAAALWPALAGPVSCLRPSLQSARHCVERAHPSGRSRLATDPEHALFGGAGSEGRSTRSWTGRRRKCLMQGPARAAIGDEAESSTSSSSVADVDWSFVDLRSDEDRWSYRLRIEMPFLDSLNKSRCES